MKKLLLISCLFLVVTAVNVYAQDEETPDERSLSLSIEKSEVALNVADEITVVGTNYLASPAIAFVYHDKGKFITADVGQAIQTVFSYSYDHVWNIIKSRINSYQASLMAESNPPAFHGMVFKTDKMNC